MKLMKLFPVALTVILALAACQPQNAASSGTTQDHSPIQIGASLPLTGRFSEPGSAAKNGYETWAAIVNENGGLLGRQVELKILDNTSDAEIAVADYENLITVDKVDLVVGPFSSFLVIPTSEVAAKHEFAFVEPAGGAPEVFNRGLTNIFFAQPAQAARQADPFALYILGLPANQRPKTFAVVSLDDPFTLGVAERIKGLLLNGGLTLVYETTYSEGTLSFTEIANDVAKLSPELIVGCAQIEDGLSQILAYQAANYQPNIAYITNAPTLPGPFKETLNNGTEGIFSSVSWFPEADEYQNSIFVTKYNELFGGTMADIPEDAANAFTVGQVLQQAIENTGSIENTTLIEELHRGSYKTIVGPLSFDETGAPQGSFMLLQWQGENFVIVGPPDRAETDPTAPPKPLW